MAWHNLRKSPDSIMADAFQSSVFLLIGQQGIWMRWRHFGHLPVALQTGLQDVRWIPEVLSAIRKLSENNVRRSCLVNAESRIEHSAGQYLFQSQKSRMGQQSCLISRIFFVELFRFRGLLV